MAAKDGKANTIEKSEQEAMEEAAEWAVVEHYGDTLLAHLTIWRETTREREVGRFDGHTDRKQGEPPSKDTHKDEHNG